ncbi:MAG: nucleotide exchange factor GrpE, partial [Candidatus Methylumidiphilus sp.]
MSEEQSLPEDSGKQPPQAPEAEELLLAEDEAAPETAETADTAEFIPAEDDAETAKPTGPIDELSAKLAAALLKSEQYRDQFLRTQADMENLRRRTEKEIQDSRKFAVERFARDLLVVLDSLELGIQAAAGDTPEVARLREGSELTLKQFLSVLEKNNVKPIDALGQKFNPE